MSDACDRVITDVSTPGETIHFHVRKMLHESRTPFQTACVVELDDHGRALFLDESIQSSQSDEHLYHEALVHPAMMLGGNPDARRVAILGGGEGATLREVLRHPSVEKAVMVDLDEQVVELCREHLPTFHQGSFDDPRSELRFQDAEQFLRNCDERFDVIVFDIVDPSDEGPGAHLFHEDFFRLIRSRLNDGGVLGLQYGPAFGRHLDSASVIMERLGKVFDTVMAGRVFVPCFHGTWGIAVAGADFDLSSLENLVNKRLPPGTRSLDRDGIRGIFSLPADVREALQP